MTSEKGHMSLSQVVPFRGHKAQVGHMLENHLCPNKSLLSFVFSIKGHKAQDKEGGHSHNEKEGKKAQKEGKREKNKKYKQNRKSLCLMPFAHSGAMA